VISRNKAGIGLTPFFRSLALSLALLLPLIWIDLSRTKYFFFFLPPPFSSSLLMIWFQGAEGNYATVDQSDIRGLVTNMTFLRRGATLLYFRGSFLNKEKAS